MLGVFSVAWSFVLLGMEVGWRDVMSVCCAFALNDADFVRSFFVVGVVCVMPAPEKKCWKRILLVRENLRS